MNELRLFGAVAITLAVSLAAACGSGGDGDSAAGGEAARPGLNKLLDSTHT